MTTQTIANLQNAIGATFTLEELAIYVGSALNYIHGNSQYKELEANGVDTGMRPIAYFDVITTPAGKRAVNRTAIPIAEDWSVTPGNIWVKSTEISLGTLPASFNASGV